MRPVPAAVGTGGMGVEGGSAVFKAMAVVNAGWDSVYLTE